jgi:hypothetical protein
VGGRRRVYVDGEVGRCGRVERKSGEGGRKAKGVVGWLREGRRKVGDGVCGRIDLEVRKGGYRVGGRVRE